MCGFFLSSSKKQNKIEFYKSKLDDIAFYIGPRGPDRLNSFNSDGIFALHSQLIITGDRPQPVSTNNHLFLFNGEIYNNYSSYSDDNSYSDTDYLVERFEEQGVGCFKELDGEFAICIFDHQKNLIYLATDSFGTKPVYYCITNDSILVSSYDSSIRALGIKDNIKRVPANTLITFDADKRLISDQENLRYFDFENQIIDSYEEWTNAFTNSIKKRTENKNHNYFIPFSSGHDSGLIVAELIHQKKTFKGYTVPYLEDLKTLNKRQEILSKMNLPFDILNINEVMYNEMHSYMHSMLEKYILQPEEFEEQNFPDPDFRNVTGYVASAIINKMAREDGYIISLSGQGADEIITDYSTGSMKMSELKGDWSNIKKPWKNLFGGWNKIFLGATERISGLFGIETRYPFLDFKLVQEFINLDPKLKSAAYKAPISHRLNQLNFPSYGGKQGFAGFDLKIKSND